MSPDLLKEVQLQLRELDYRITPEDKDTFGADDYTYKASFSLSSFVHLHKCEGDSLETCPEVCLATAMRQLRYLLSDMEEQYYILRGKIYAERQKE